MDKRMKEGVQNIIGIAVLGIGAYMLFTFSGGGLTPPVISGAAFMFTGAYILMR